MKRLARLVAAALTVAAAGLGVPGPVASAATAAPCTGGSGVIVVVDFNSLGGGVQQACVAGGGGDSASSLFPAAGFELKYATRQAGFVCRVEGVPMSDPCVHTAPADAFWGLWWSDGSGWTFSSLGAASISIPDGGLVAFSWDDVSGSAPPSASASQPDPPSSPEPPDAPQDQRDPDDEPRQGPGGGPASGPGSTGPVPSASPSASEKIERGRGGMDRERKRKPERSGTESPTAPAAGPSETAASDAGSVTDPATDSDGLPAWVAPTLIGVLFAAAGVVLLVRRRRSET